jgi:hypothetical protein
VWYGTGMKNILKLLHFSTTKYLCVMVHKYTNIVCVELYLPKGSKVDLKKQKVILINKEKNHI